MFIDTLKFIKFAELSDDEKKALTKTLKDQKKVLQEALAAVNQDLKSLAKKAKRKTKRS